jgi:hypothetical protein
MKKFILKTFSCISFIILSINLISASPLDALSNKKSETLIVRDSASITGLPDRFRDIPNLNISGSAQFTSEQVTNLRDGINKPNICIVDLRQESHGLVNDYAISFFNPTKDLNNGFTTEQTIKTEDLLLSKIKLNDNLNIYRKTGVLFKELTVNFVSNESSVVNKSGMEYKRYAVKDNGAPTAEIVDQFVEFVKTKPSDLHLHFHCDAGEGRTTTFMSMYQILMNNTNLSLEQILSYQYNVGGVNLHDNKTQFEFLEDFYNYVSKNKSNNYTTTYSEWIKEA